MEKIEFTYQHNLRSLYQFTLWLIYFKNKYWLKQLLAFIVLVLYIVFCLYQHGVNIVILIVLIISNLFVLMIPILSLITTRKNYYKYKFSEIITHYTIDSNGLLLETSEASIKYDWENILEVKEMKDYFYVLAINSNIIILHKALFSNQVQVFKNLIVKVLPQHKCKFMKK
ncbi:MAG: YcxB family protein [Bacilli bacterium]|nr:YcxB family protein [Bacilli bacterium]